MQNNSQINWKYYEVEVIAPDGVVLNGTIKYWAKDYSICMTEPLVVHGCGSHLQYGIPAVYVTDEPPRKKVHQINLIERAKEVLLSIYVDKKEQLDALDVQRLIESGYFYSKNSLLSLACQQWKISEIDTILLEDQYNKRVKQLKGAV